ncbi:MAG TPA: hypothetical protein VFS24_15735 [Steroidobacteraceae bacterium]|nr:hypothetical protein [Steroidobacteraceae bacterium]
MNRYELFARSVALRWGVIAILAAVLACVGIRLAEAQTVTAEANVTWTLPTTDTLGQPLTGDRALTKLQLYVSTSPIADDTTITPIELPPGTTTYVYEQAVPNGSTLYFRLRACNQICSALSEDTPQSRKQIRVSVPNVPTGVTVTLKVNLAITEP